VTGVVLGWLAPLLLVIILQAGAELFIIRHYGIAVVMITPLVLVMAQTVDAQPVAVLLLDRTVQTVLGVGVAVMVIVATGYVREMAGKHRPE
jgi:MFS family permease